MNINILKHSANVSLIIDIYKSNGFRLCNENISSRVTNNSSTSVDHASMFIFPRASMNPRLLRDGPIGVIYRCC